MNSPVKTEVIPMGLTLLTGPPEIAICGWRIINRFTKAQLSQSMSPYFESIASVFFSQLDSKVIITEGYLFALSDAIVSVIHFCWEESFDQIIMFTRICIDRLGAIINGHFAQWAEQTFGDAQIAPSMLSCLLVIVAGAIQRCSSFITSPDLHDLVNSARGIVYHVLDHPGNLDIVESEAIHLLSTIVSTIPAALHDGSAMLIEHLLRELSSPSDEIAGDCASLIGDLYVRYSSDLLPYAESFMTMLFQRLASPTLRFLQAAKLLYAVGDILANLESNDAVVYRDATTGVLRAFARMDVGNDQELTAEVIHAMLHVSSALISFFGKADDPDSIKHFKMCRHLLFDAVKKLFRFIEEGSSRRGDLLDEFINLMTVALNPAVQAILAVQISWPEVGSLIETAIQIAHQKSDHIREARAKVIERRRKTLAHFD
jgi:hypothetical protein